jgi:methionyl-tRNA formyltransferase
LLAAGHEVPLVLTQPDRPAGRGLRSAASAVKQLAQARGLEVFQPASLKDDAAFDRLAGVRAQALVVAAYGLILPQRVLALAPSGALNIHASLLPRWRGAAPIQRALLAGDTDTGITIMQMDAGLDTGPVLSQHRLAIDANDDAGSLHDKLAALGAEAMVLALAEIAAGRARALPQPEAGILYAHKLTPQDAEIDWSQSCVQIERRLRAMRPAPGARTLLRGESLKLWRASCDARVGVAGTVLASGSAGVLIACGEGALQVTELQRAGGRRLAAGDFLRGCPIEAGEHLGPAR